MAANDTNEDHLECVYDILTRFNLLHHLHDTNNVEDDDLSEDDGLTSLEDLLKQSNQDRSRSLSESVNDKSNEPASQRKLSFGNNNKTQRYEVFDLA